MIEEIKSRDDMLTVFAIKGLVSLTITEYYPALQMWSDEYGK